MPPCFNVIKFAILDKPPPNLYVPSCSSEICINDNRHINFKISNQTLPSFYRDRITRGFYKRNYEKPQTLSE